MTRAWKSIDMEMTSTTKNFYHTAAASYAYILMESTICSVEMLNVPSYRFHACNIFEN